MKLFNDDARCADTDCPDGQTCERFLQRLGGGERTPMYATMRNREGDCVNKIEAKPKEER